MIKKILILGGAIGQVPLIKSAKKEGYYVVLCDWTTTNPGIELADKHYQVSSLDRDAVLEIALKEKVNGVVSNSEPAMANVAYISEKLKLVGNPESSIEILLSKNKFRNLQEKLKLFAPIHYKTNNKEEFWKKIQKFNLPVIIKPVKSSGSRGTTKIEKLDYNQCINAFEECSKYSADKCCSIEEFVESSIDYIIDGDVFIYNNHYFWDGMFFNYRHKLLKMIPTTESWPLKIDDILMIEIKRVLKLIFDSINIKFGEYNVEMYINKYNELFIIEINPRQGGCGIPLSIKEHCGIDYSKLLVTLAVGDEHYFNECINYKKEIIYYTRNMVFSTEEGIFRSMFIDERIKKFIKKISYKVKKGDKIKKSKNATDVLAYVDLVFDSYDNQKKYDSNLERYIYPILG